MTARTARYMIFYLCFVQMVDQAEPSLLDQYMEKMTDVMFVADLFLQYHEKSHNLSNLVSTLHEIMHTPPGTAKNDIEIPYVFTFLSRLSYDTFTRLPKLSQQVKYKNPRSVGILLLGKRYRNHVSLSLLGRVLLLST